MTMHKRRTTWGFSIVDGLLAAGVVALLCGCVLGVASNPTWWRWCLDVLDVRDWGRWTRTGVGVALLGMLLLIRAWPEKKC